MQESNFIRKWFRFGIRLKIVDALSILEDVIYIILALLFALSATAILAEFIWTIRLNSYPKFIENSLDHFLIVFMLIELMHTILLFLKTHHFRHEPFLMVGIIAGIRALLILSANHTAMGQSAKLSFLWELGVTAGVILILAIALRISRVPEERSSGGE